MNPGDSDRLLILVLIAGGLLGVAFIGIVWTLVELLT